MKSRNKKAPFLDYTIDAIAIVFANEQNVNVKRIWEGLMLMFEVQE